MSMHPFQGIISLSQFTTRKEDPQLQHLFEGIHSLVRNQVTCQVHGRPMRKPCSGRGRQFREHAHSVFSSDLWTLLHITVRHRVRNLKKPVFARDARNKAGGCSRARPEELILAANRGVSRHSGGSEENTFLTSARVAVHFGIGGRGRDARKPVLLAVPEEPSRSPPKGRNKRQTAALSRYRSDRGRGCVSKVACCARTGGPRGRAELFTRRFSASPLARIPFPLSLEPTPGSKLLK